MIYHPDENVTPSWSNISLRSMGYNRDPEKLQLLIAKCYEQVISTIEIPGTEVIPVPLFNILNGKRSEDYVGRVEPSALGGKKMAEYFLDLINGKITNSSMERDQYSPPSVHSSTMTERD